MTTIYGLVRRAAARAPDAPCLQAPGRQPLSYAATLDAVESLAVRLRGQGVGRGDAVAVLMEDRPELALLFLAVSSCAVFAPLNPRSTRAELEFALEDLRVSAVVLAQGEDTPLSDIARARGLPVIEIGLERAGRIDAFGPCDGDPHGPHANPCEAGDLALLLHSSGTTAEPKLVALTHRNLCTAAADVGRTLALKPSDRCLNVMPLFHAHGLVAITLSSVAAGGSVVYLSGPNAPELTAELADPGLTWYSCSPTLHRHILDHWREGGAELTRSPNLRFIRSSSAPMPVDLEASLEEVFGVPVLQAYAMSETSYQIASNPLPPAVRKPGSVGLPDGPELALHAPDGRVCETFERGEIVVRGPGVIRGYGLDRDQHPEAFRDGWLRTGDEGYQDEDGYLFLTGRLKELINRGGEKISPLEVDTVLRECPGIDEVVTFGVAHPTLGEDVAAAVVVKSGFALSESEVRAFAAARLAPYKVPGRVVVTDAIPKVATGKVRRGALETHFGSLVAVAPARKRNQVERQLAELWADLLGIDEVRPTDNLFAIGVDSINSVSLADAACRAGLEISPVDILRYPRIRDLAAAIASSPTVAASPAPGSPSTRSRVCLPLQRTLLELTRKLPSVTGIIQCRYLIRGDLEVELLRRAWQEVCEECETLRVGFGFGEDGIPVQTIHEEIGEISWHVHDVRAEAAPLEAAERLLDLDIATPFRLDQPPLLRLRVVRLEDDRVWFAWAAHHGIRDGWSARLIETKVFGRYDSLVRNETRTSVDLEPRAYSRFLDWYADQKEKATQKYWDEMFGGFDTDQYFEQVLGLLAGDPATLAPASEPARRALEEKARELSQSGRRQPLGSHTFPASKALTEGLAALSKDGISSATLCHAAIVQVLSRTLDRDDILITSAGSGRMLGWGGIESVPGCLALLRPLRLTVDPKMSIGGWLTDLQSLLLEAHRRSFLANQEITSLPRRQPEALLYLCVVNFHGYFRRLPPLRSEDLEIDTMTAATRDSTIYPLGVHGLVVGDQLGFSLVHNPELLPAALFARLAASFEDTLETLVREPRRSVGSIASDRQTIPS